MADDALEQFRGFFWPQALGLDPKANLKMREKIALAQMMQKRAMPKNLGEGLTAIGEALGERRLAIELEKQDRLSQEAGALLGATPAAASPVVTPTIRSSYAPTTDVETEEPTEPPPLATQVPPQQVPTPAPVVVRPPAPVPPPVQPPVVPPQALPPDQQQTYGPGDPVRMPARPYRPGGPQPGAGAPMAQPPPQAAAPPPPAGPAPLPPGDIPAPTFNDRMAPAGPAAGPRAEGGDPRAAIAMAWLQQQGTSPENPTTPAGGGPPGNGITDFSAQSRIRSAPQPAATPGYVPPEAADPEGVPLARPSRREMELRTLLRQHQGNPYAATSPAAVELQQLEAARARQDLEAQEIYKAKILRTTTAKELRERALMDQQKRIDDADAAAEALRKARIPEVKKDIEEGHWFNPATNEWEVPRIAGTDPNKKPKFTGTEFQGKTMINYGRAAIAEEGLRKKPEGSDETYEEVLANSPLSSLGGSVPLVGRTLRSSAYKEADTHAENFVQSFIRQQSGAGFGVAELEAEARSMLPRYGDTKKQLETKREQREQFINGTYAVVGTSGQKGLDIDARNRAAGRAVPEFKTEAEAAVAARHLPRNANGKVVVRIGGRLAEMD